MSSNLAATLKTIIQENGPIGVDRYMAMAAAHYYTHHVAIGQDGDFTTSPEINQIFGEMVGLWVMAHWAHHGKPAAFILCECGPGRGTLMADILRTIKAMPACLSAAHVHFVEISPAMRARQADALGETQQCQWHDSIDTVPTQPPLILIANEFLDALPTQQFKREDNGWAEHVVGLSDDGELIFGLMPHAPLPFDHINAGQMIELSPARNQFCNHIKTRFAHQNGSALFIDYGYHVPPVGNTLQAIYNKKPCHPLSHPGQADITTHVDFHSLNRLFEGYPHILTTQQAWIKGMGGDDRLQQLCSGNPAHTQTLTQSYQRLTATDQMGHLFKVLEVRSV